MAINELNNNICWWGDKHAAGSTQKVWKSVDMGLTWALAKDLGATLPNGGIGYIGTWPGDVDKVFVMATEDATALADDNAIMYSPDGGTTWHTLMGNWDDIFGAYAGTGGSGGGCGNMGLCLLPRIGANAPEEE
jgi:hypothetical protein